MPVDTTYTLFDYSGASVATTTTTRVVDTDVVISLADGSSLPLAGSGKYAAVTINRGLSDEERVFYSARVGNELQGCIRGADDSSALTHEAGATVEHTSTAKDAREANAVATAIGGDTGATAAHTLANTFSPTDATNSQALVAAFSTTDASHAQGLYTATAAISTWTPTFSALDGDTYTNAYNSSRSTFRYMQIGKFVQIWINVLISFTGGTGAGDLGITLPVTADLGATSDANVPLTVAAQNNTLTTTGGLRDATHIGVHQNSGTWTGDGVQRWIRIEGTYPAA